MRAIKIKIPTERPAFLVKFLSNKDGYQNRVMGVAAGLLFFVLPAMVSGAIVLSQLFLIPGAYTVPRGANNQVLYSDVIDQFVPRIAITGIIFFIGIFIILYATRGFPDLENVLVGVGFMLIAAGAVVSLAMTQRCFSRDCDTFKYIAGVTSLLVLVLVGFVIPSGLGKKIGWYAFIFFPVLLYQVVRWMPFLFSTDQSTRSAPEVLKATILLFIVVGIIVWMGIGGGWPERPNST